MNQHVIGCKGLSVNRTLRMLAIRILSGVERLSALVLQIEFVWLCLYALAAIVYLVKKYNSSNILDGIVFSMVVILLTSIVLWISEKYLFSVALTISGIIFLSIPAFLQSDNKLYVILAAASSIALIIGPVVQYLETKSGSFSKTASKNEDSE